MEVRRARPEEYDEVGALTVEVYVAGGLIDPGSSYVRTLRDGVDRGLRAEVFVAVHDGTLVGAVAYCPPGSPYRETAGADEAEFRMLAVRGVARGGGAGRALVQLCLDRASASGLTAVRLSTQPNMTAAHRLYERMGFHRTPERDWTPVPDVDLLTYVHDL